MEEDINILEELLQGAKDNGMYNNNKYFYSIENLIKGYREKEESEKYLYDAYQDAGKKMFEYAEKCDELEKENESKEKAYNDCYCEFKHYKQYESIPKSKVKELYKEYYEKAFAEPYDCTTADYKHSQAMGGWRALDKLLMEDK